MSQQTPWDQNQDRDDQPQDPLDPQQHADDAADVQSAGESDAVDADAGPDVDVRALQAERDSLFDKLARTQAEFKNAQRRLEQDKQQAIQYANASLVKSLIPVIDNLDRAAAVDPAKTDAAAILKGMQIILDQFANVLANQGVDVENPAPGSPFDPTRHEALMHQPSDQYTQPTVTLLLQKGYIMHGRTLRPAGVAVSP